MEGEGLERDRSAKEVLPPALLGKLEGGDGEAATGSVQRRGEAEGGGGAPSMGGAWGGADSGGSAREHGRTAGFPTTRRWWPRCGRARRTCPRRQRGRARSLSPARSGWSTVEDGEARVGGEEAVLMAIGGGGGVDGLRTVTAVPRKATAQREVDRRCGATRLEATMATVALLRGGCGVSSAGDDGRVVAEARRGAAEPMAVATQRGGGGSDG